MYRIVIPTGEMYLTEKITYVRKHSSGTFLITDKRRAEGVAYKGEHYMFSDGTQVVEVDTGSDIQEFKETESLVLELAADHEARICNFELGV